MVRIDVTKEGLQTERQRREDTLPQIGAEERYRAILESSDEGLLVLDRQDRVIDANERLEEIIGYERSDIVGRTILSLARLLTNKGLTVALRNHLKRGVGANSTPYEVDVFKKEGELVTVQIKYHPFKADGTVVGRLVILRDVTLRTCSERESRESQEVYKSLVNHVGVGVFRTTPGATGRFLEVNPAMEEITGYSREELLRINVAELYVHPEERADMVKEVLSGIPTKPREVRFKKKDGTEIVVRDQKVTVRGNDSKALYLEGFLEDITERKMVEETLKKSTQLLNDTGEIAEVGGWELDLSTEEVSWTEEVSRIHAVEPGYKPKLEEVLDFYAPESRPDVEAAIKRTTETGEPYDLKSLLIPRGSKDKVWVRLIGKAIYSGGKIVKLAGTFQNIDKYEKVKETLRESEERYKTILQTAMDGFWLTDTQGHVMEVNEIYCQMSGYSRQELITMSITDLEAAEAKSDTSSHLKKVMTQGADRFVSQHRRKDGSTFDVEISVQYQPIESGRLVVFLRDVTERKKTEEELVLSNTILKTQAESSFDGILVVDTEGKILSFNQRFRDIWKIPQDVLDSRSDERALQSVLNNLVEPQEFLQKVQYLYQHRDEFSREDIALKDGRMLERYSAPMFGATKVYYGRLWEFHDITDRKQMEEKLRIRAKLLDAAADSAFCHDLDGKLIYVNEIAYKSRGYTKDELLSLGLSSLDAPGFRELIPARMGELMKNGSASFESAHICKDGTVMPVEIHASLFESSGRNIILGMIRDITERKHKEEELQKSEENLKAYLENAPDAVYISDLKGKFLYGNKNAERITGYKREELLGKNFTQLHLLSPRDLATAIKLLAFNFMGKPTGPDEFELTRKDGSRIFVEINTTSIKRNGERQAIGFVRDITERKGMEEKIKLAAEEWRRTFDSITDLISIQDKDFRIVKVNKAYADVFKRKPQELLGKTCYELIHGTDGPVQNCPHQRTLQSGKPFREEFFEPNLGIFLEVNTSPIFDVKGNVVGSVHIARDISVRKRMDQQLVLNGRLASVGELAAGVAHELNNPLTSVIGFSQQLMGREISDDIKEDLSIVYSEAQRAAGIVKNLLTFARQHAPVKQLIRIENVIEDVLRLRAYEQKINNIEVIRRFAPDLPEIIADYPQMEQVFLNIILNAEFFMIEAHKKGSLTITTEKIGSMVSISFADDGPGISSENLSRLFNPFFTTKEVGKGTGLGLSICHGIMTEHGGRIYVRSQVGTGATFVIELPVDGTKQAGGVL
jgi:PAS domain S-box-containing protein